MRAMALMGMLLVLLPIPFALDCSMIGKNGTIYSDTVLSGDLSSQGRCVSIGRDNVSLDCAGHALSGSGGETGVYVFGRKGVEVKNCRISNFNYGLYISYSDSSAFKGNRITSCYIGALLSSSSNLFFEENFIDNNGQGIYAYDLLESTISKGSAKGNKGHGLELRSSFTDKITGNDFSSNGVGIGAYSSSDIEIAGNDLRSCYLGYSESKSRGIRFYENSQDILSGNDWSTLTRDTRQLFAYVLVVLVVGVAVFVIGRGRRKKDGGEEKERIGNISVGDIERARTRD